MGYRCGMVDCHAIGHSPSTVVPDKGEAIMPGGPHGNEQGISHLALRHGIPNALVRATASTITGQIGGNHSEFASKQRSDLPPHQAGFRKTMQEKNRKPVTSLANEDHAAIAFKQSRAEAGEWRQVIGHHSGTAMEG